MEKYKIVKIKHIKLTQGLLWLCAMLPSYYFDNGSEEECERILDAILAEAKRTTFLRRNAWEPLEIYYRLKRERGRLLIESLQGKAYLEFSISRSI